MQSDPDCDARESPSALWSLADRASISARVRQTLVANLLPVCLSLRQITSLGSFAFATPSETSITGALCLSDDAVSVVASGPEEAHAPMNISIATSEICLIIVSPKVCG